MGQAGQAYDTPTDDALRVRKRCSVMVHGLARYASHGGALVGEGAALGGLPAPITYLELLQQLPRGADEVLGAAVQLPAQEGAHGGGPSRCGVGQSTGRGGSRSGRERRPCVVYDDQGIELSWHGFNLDWLALGCMLRVDSKHTPSIQVRCKACRGCSATRVY